MGLPTGLSRDTHSGIVAEYSRPEFFETTARELSAYFRTTAEQRQAGGFGSLGATPLAVITHGKPFTGQQAFLEKGWAEAQAREDLEICSELYDLNFNADGELI